MPKVSVGSASTIRSNAEKKLNDAESKLSVLMFQKQKDCGYTQDEIARKCGLSRQTVSNIFRKPLHCRQESLYRILWIIGA